MAVHRAEATAHSAACPSTVYALLTTGATWPSWIFVDSAELEREQVLQLVPDRKFAHGLLAGLPIRDHRADVDLTPGAAGGTDIRWSATWRPSYPGTGPLLRVAIRQIYRGFSAGLARRAAEVEQPGTPRGSGRQQGS